jgi:hypothetical protein
VRMSWVLLLAERSGTNQADPSWQPTASGVPTPRRGPGVGLRTGQRSRWTSAQAVPAPGTARFGMARWGGRGYRTRSSPLPMRARDPSVRRPSAR